IYFVELYPANSIFFDNSDVVSSVMVARTLESGSWIDQGSFPVAARPKLNYGQPADSSRTANSYFAELIKKDIDGDGLMEIQMENGQWVGFSGNSLVIKNP
ncbi:MAG: hypothetical protein ACE5ES_00815, partial [Candidatus Nanoarchaeia archaeon]